jgi:anti-sigma B factor antagonist
MPEPVWDQAPPERESYAGERRGDAILACRGELDVADAVRFREDLDRLIAERRGEHAVVDMREVTFIDSVGLGELIRGFDRGDRAGTRLQLVASGAVARVLQAANVLLRPGFLDHSPGLRRPDRG